jgi:hypothetical protein
VADTFLSGLSAFLGDDPDEVSVHHWSTDGDEHALLQVGPHLNVQTTQASPETLRKLAACALDLADWIESKNAAAREQVRS